MRAAARRAEALAARLPPLLLAAERVAATVAAGLHGRRRVGEGDSFWQFRPFATGDATARIDWRQSAKSHRTFVRETEWEAAQTCFLWRDASPSMRWRSALAPVEKAARAELLLLALAALLLRGGERVRLIDIATPFSAGTAALAGLAEALARAPEGAGLPQVGALPRFATVVLISDFLSPIAEISALLGRFAALSARGVLLHILDPAERDLPYDGRVRFLGLEGEGEMVIPRVEGVRAAYQARLAAQTAAVAESARKAGFGFASHLTDRPPETALLALYMALAA